jgi:hypothetical protein
VTTYFLLWSLYFYISALQLQLGYREVKLRNTMLKSYNNFSNIMVKVYYAIPFLFELKVLMDWTFIKVAYLNPINKTSLDVFQWFKLENIQSLMHSAKIQSNDYLERKVGATITPFIKLSLGCSLVLFILLCMFGPLVLFSTLNPSTELNLVPNLK